MKVSLLGLQNVGFPDDLMNDFDIRFPAGAELEQAVEWLLEDVGVRRLNFASRLLASSFCKRQAVDYAVFAAESVLGLFEKEYPDDNRPRCNIQEAKSFVKHTGVSLSRVQHDRSAMLSASRASGDASLCRSLKERAAKMAAACAAMAADEARAVAFILDRVSVSHVLRAELAAADASALAAYAMSSSTGNETSRSEMEAEKRKTRTRLQRYAIELVCAKGTI